MESKKENGQPGRFRQYVSPALQDLPILATMSPLTGMQAIIHDRIWDSILNGELKPGAKVPEVQIGAAFNVSRTIVRNVLIVMEQEEIITLPPNRGAYIAIQSPQKIKQAFEGASVAARHIVRSLAKNAGSIGAADKQRLKRHLKFELPAAPARNQRSHMRFGMEFLLLLAAIHGNTMLLGLVERATSIILIALPQLQLKPVSWPKSEAKQQVVDAILAGNPDEAERVLTAFLAPLEQSFDDRLEEQTKDVSSIISSLSQGLELPPLIRQRTGLRRKSKKLPKIR